MTSQRSSEFATPSRDDIVAISKKHVSKMESSDADEVWIWVGMHHLLLRTIGRRTGKEHKVALPFWRDPDGHRIVVASFAGAAADPAWYLNLADREVNPTVRVAVQGGSFWSEPELLDDDERRRIWDLLVVDRPHYTEYQRTIERTIPLVRLREPAG